MVAVDGPGLWPTVPAMTPHRPDVASALLLFGLPLIGATHGDLRHAYRRLAVETHPDLGGSALRFRRIAAAHDLLSRTLPAGPATRRFTAPVIFARRSNRPVIEGAGFEPWSGADWTGASSGVAWIPTAAPTRRRSRR